MLISAITADPSIQPRDSLDPKRLEELTQILKDGAELAPVTVFFDGEIHWLADGFHRYQAHLITQRTEISVEVHQGTYREALIYGIQINAAHGLGLTLTERKQAARKLLLDPEWRTWNDSTITRICRIDRKTLLKIKHQILKDNESSSSEQASMFRKPPSPESLQTVSLGNPNDNQNEAVLQSVSLGNPKDSENPELLQSASLGNPKDSEKSSERNSSKVKVSRRGAKYEIDPTKIGQWRKQKLTGDELSKKLAEVVDITNTTQVINEILPPSLNTSSSEFRVLLVSYDSPLFADNGIEISLKAIHNGPAYALPMIFDQLMFHPPFAASVFKQAEELAKKSGRNFNN